jgi:hypothetical protein
MAVLAHAKATEGEMLDVDRRLREDGTYAESAAVHAAYVALAGPPRSDLEALKRAIFLAWYQRAEPGCLTGIGDLCGQALERNWAILEKAFDGSALDDELTVMLGWYQYTGYGIGGYPAANGWRECVSPAFRVYLVALDGSAYKRHHFSRGSLQQRGQMGEYWISIVCRPD